MTEHKPNALATEGGVRRLPTTNHPLNAEPRKTAGPLILTLILVAAIVGVLVFTVSLITH
ncbi:MAG TPA: hypothetical protein VF165_02520 [Nocardioidaceae bacterium]|jgi:hypothetical protein